jgi:non-ribosomal peptide synthetase component F
MRSAEPPLSFDVDRVPPVPGQYETITVNAATALSSAGASVLGIPDDWSWVVKFGALSDLFGRESVAKDSTRAEYCAKRYAHGLTVLTNAAALLGIRLSNVPLDIDSARNADYFNPAWQAFAGVPTRAYVMGLNLVAFSPQPNSSTAYSVTAHVVQNAPVPVNQGDPIQLSREDFDAVLDYSQHLAVLKVGGAEFAMTMPLLDRFMKRAVVYNSKLAAMGELQRAMYETSQLESERNPRYSSAVAPEGANA